MGGRIWLESELGKGSTFYLEIPRTDRIEAMRMLEAETSEIVSDAELAPIDTAEALENATPEIASTSETPAQSSAPIAQPAAPAVAAVEEAAAPNIPSPAQAPTPPTLAAIEEHPNEYIAATRSSASMQIPARNTGDANNPPRS